MEIAIYPLLVLPVAIFFLARVIIEYRKGNRKLPIVLIWVGVTLFVSAIAIFPDPVSFPLAKLLGFKSNINAVIFVSLGILFGINYSLSSRLSKMERKFADLVRSLAKDSPQSPEK